MPRAGVPSVVGTRFGTMVTAGPVRSGGPGVGRIVDVVCDCGERKTVRVRHLALAKTCGNRSLHAACNTQHGHAPIVAGVLRRSPTYNSWMNMIQRCTNPNRPDWERYGGRGITVCEAWSDFATFLADMGERPTGRTLDRVDNEGGYEPDNCRWATAVEQRRNQRPRRRKATA